MRHAKVDKLGNIVGDVLTMYARTTSIFYDLLDVKLTIRMALSAL